MRIELTDKCNLNCSYCHASPNKKQEVIDQATLENIIAKVPIIGLPTLSGGEPFLVFSKLILALHLLQNYYGGQTKVQTNATLITQEHCDILKNFSVRFRVSLDGPTAEVHNIKRQQFDETVAGIKLLVANGFRTETTCVLSASNYKHIEEHIKFCESLGLSFIQFRKVLYDDTFTSEMLDESTRLVEDLKNSDRFSIDFKFKPCEKNKPGRGCQGRLCFLTDGSVQPCGNIKYTVGNINEDTVSCIKSHKIWDHFGNYNGCAMNTWEADKEEFLRNSKDEDAL